MFCDMCRKYRSAPNNHSNLSEIEIVKVKTALIKFILSETSAILKILQTENFSNFENFLEMLYLPITINLLDT